MHGTDKGHLIEALKKYGVVFIEYPPAENGQSVLSRPPFRRYLDLHFELEKQEWQGRSQKWRPFKHGNGEDLARSSTSSQKKYKPDNRVNFGFGMREVFRRRRSDWGDERWMADNFRETFNYASGLLTEELLAFAWQSGGMLASWAEDDLIWRLRNGKEGTGGWWGDNVVRQSHILFLQPNLATFVAPLRSLLNGDPADREGTTFRVWKDKKSKLAYGWK